MNRAARIVLVASIAGWLAAPASAHVSDGLFRFLVPALDDPIGAARFLQEQVSNLDERLVVLRRELMEQEAAYQAKLEETVPRLRFYEVYSGSAVGALWANAQNPVDIIASTELLEKVVRDDLAALAWLERVKEHLGQKRDSLVRYRALLKAFQLGVEARRDLMMTVPPEWRSRREEFVVSSINEAWNGGVRDLALVPYFVGLGGELSSRFASGDGLLEATAAGSWTISEQRLNRAMPETEFIREPVFHLRADHLYFHARAEVPTEGRPYSYHILVVGWLNRAARSAVQYNVDAVYLDGVPIDVYDPQLRTPMILGKFLRFDFSSLISGEETVGVEQHNGYILVHTT